MNNICRICNSEKNDEYRNLYEPCDSCNTRRVLRYYYKNKEKILEKKEKLLL